MAKSDLACATRPVAPLKRGADILFAVAALPLLCAVAVCLLVLNPGLNPGPLLFAQSRIGQGGRPFRLLKFRSMVGTPGVPAFATEETCRLRPLGAVLRRAHLDELPQLINILRGEMSLVGPRPEQVSFAQHYARAIPGYAARHQVRPGITGRAQILQGYAASAPEAATKLRHDLAYIHDARAHRDLHIVIASIALACLGRRFASTVLTGRVPRLRATAFAR